MITIKIRSILLLTKEFVMQRRFTVITTLVTALFLNVSIAFTQVDSFMINVRKNIEKAEKEKALRTKEEDKLETPLYQLLRLAEEADTSLEKKAKLSKLMKKDKFFHVDTEGRVRVIIDLKSLDDTDNVKSIIHSLGGGVEQVGLVPYIQCTVHPKKLRSLIRSDAIRLIRIPAQGFFRR